MSKRFSMRDLVSSVTKGPAEANPPEAPRRKAAPADEIRTASASPVAPAKAGAVLQGQQGPRAPDVPNFVQVKSSDEDFEDAVVVTPSVRDLAPTAGRAVAPFTPPPTSGEASFSIDDMKSILLDMGVKESHVLVAMRRAQTTGEPLAQIMRDFGFLSGEGVAQAVSRQTRFDYFSVEDVDQIARSDMDGLRLPEFKRFVPVGLDSAGRLLIAVPDASVVNEALNSFYAKKTRIVIASEHTIQTVYRKFFANTEKSFDESVAAFMKAAEGGRRKEEDERAVGLVREVYFSMLRHACYSGASDLYLHRSEYVGIVRLKVNGVGQIFRTIDLALYDRVLNKLVQDNTKADDLRIKPKEAIVEFSEEDREKHSDLATRFNFRLELTESRGVRSAVIRILDRNSAATDLDKLGFDEQTLKAIVRTSKTATGFFLVTGPTGSGKTTTLYAILKSVDAVERSVQSIENPVEYEHGLWLQFEPRKDAANEGEELNEWLKALLRNAPDVILVGEVRDKNVANICLNAANTGHLVFATLHTNDAVMAMARLKSLQIDLDVLGSVLLGILAQRLVRLLCRHCKVLDESPDTVDALDASYLGAVMKKPYRAGSGCANCDYTSYRGRRMIYELLQVTPLVREALEKGEPPSVLAKHGMPEDRTMWANGLKMVALGHTSLEELQRVATRHI